MAVKKRVSSGLLHFTRCFCWAAIGVCVTKLLSSEGPWTLELSIVSAAGVAGFVALALDSLDEFVEGLLHERE